jgi:hypothetical protein
MKADLRTLLLGASIGIALFLGYSFRPVAVPQAYTYRQFSTIESVVPGGLGRSRVITSDESDQIIVETINKHIAEGWELHTVTTGVNDSGGGTGGGGGTGIFITRYLFRRPL